MLISFSDSMQIQLLSAREVFPVKKAKEAGKLQLLARKDRQPLGDEELLLAGNSRPGKGIGFNELQGQEDLLRN